MGEAEKPPARGEAGISRRVVAHTRDLGCFGVFPTRPAQVTGQSCKVPGARWLPAAIGIALGVESCPPPQALYLLLWETPVSLQDKVQQASIRLFLHVQKVRREFSEQAQAVPGVRAAL